MTTAAFRLSEFDTAPAIPCGPRRAEPAHPDAEVAYAFEIITTREGFDVLEGEWNDLFAHSGAPTQVFQTFNWCWHWCNHFLDARTSLAVLTARRDGRLVLILPLVTERATVITRLIWLGEPVGQYGDAIIDEFENRHALLDATWRHLKAHVRADLMHLRKVRSDAAIAPYLRQLDARVTHQTEAPYLDLTSAANFAVYEQRYSAKARKNRRRLMRRLEEQGPVEITHHRENAEAGALAAAALALKRAWLKARGMLSPALSDPRTKTFFAAAARDSVRPTGCNVSALRCDDHLAGVQVGFACKNRLSMHIIVYDLAFEKSGVGVLHLEHAIRHACEAGYTAVDLLAPNDSYKMDWADGTIGVDDHAVALTLKGRAFVRLYLGHLRQRLKALAQRVPGLARLALPLTAVL